MSKALIQMREIDLRLQVGENLALTRTALGCRQIDWVRRYPEHLTSSGKLANYESGLRLASPLFLIQLCADYGLSMDWFFRGRRDGVTESTALLLRRALSTQAAVGAAAGGSAAVGAGPG